MFLTDYASVAVCVYTFRLYHTRHVYAHTHERTRAVLSSPVSSDYISGPASDGWNETR